MGLMNGSLLLVLEIRWRERKHLVISEECDLIFQLVLDG